ncbi:MAG: adenylyltransferase/cytidyltransferase family protein [Pseudomonadales bacterium]|jgi:cytidyltransferase-like protein|nr:adenylyltransferase/cytidyltransferase family protein [Pseudomonadales bacterium]
MSQHVLKNEILLTIFHASLYGYPLKKEQIYQRLLCSNRVSEQNYNFALNALVESGLIFEKKQHFGVIFKKNYIKGFFTRNEYAKQKITSCQDFIHLMSRFSFVKAIAFTGSVAIDNSSKNDDIDILIIGEHGYTYRIRALVLILSTFYYKRRTSDNDKQCNKWCVNVVLDVENLEIPTSKHTLFGATELLQAKFAYDGGNYEKKFRNKNLWIANYFKQLNIESAQNSDNCSKNGVDSESLRSESQLEFLLKALQQRYMKSKITREIVNDGQLFFHPRKCLLPDKNSLEKLYRKYVESLHVNSDEKLSNEVKNNLYQAKKAGQSIVLVTGVFDLFHEKHLEFLKRSIKDGEVLVVGVESDKRVRKIKGKNRPLRSELVRLGRVLQLPFVDTAFILPDNFGQPKIVEKLLKEISPDYLAISNTSPHQDKKRIMIEQSGGKLRLIKMQSGGISSSQILEGGKSLSNLVYKVDREFSAKYRKQQRAKK